MIPINFMIVDVIVLDEVYNLNDSDHQMGPEKAPKVLVNWTGPVHMHD